MRQKGLLRKFGGRKPMENFSHWFEFYFFCFLMVFHQPSLASCWYWFLCNSKRRGNRMYVVRYYMTCPCFSLILWRYSFLNRYYMTCPLHSSSFMGWFLIWNTCICCVCMCPIGVYLGKEFYINELVLIFWFTSLFE